ncbi:hypothetical protein TrVE_jg1302 [Triparma verrucosa]|uniref:Fe2OG dioxygenase domain-containing protein n=1 Tax=Triparma verrucosa TaxID=1606542 RepID=A0A9W7BR57_9STRA|nr:hypothetical protein TrVE_jg1302 [Triparma verrucosa]
MVRELSGCFRNTLPEGEMREGFEEFINSKLGQKKEEEEEVKWKKKDIKAEIVDDAAQKILEYVCSTGQMPEEEEEEEDKRELYAMKSDYLPLAVFEKLQENVRKHPGLLNTSSSSLGVGFDTTKGFIFRFSYKGVEKFKEHEWGKCLVPFFDEAREEGMSAYVLNVLFCPPTYGDGGGSYSVNFHKDATLALTPEAALSGVKQRLAHSVSVLYLDVPDGMEGGELVLRNVDREALRGEERYGRGKEGVEIEVDAVVEPKNNFSVKFRGDAEHAVKAFRNTTMGRVSLVLEQYKVPVGDKGWLLEFELVEPGKYKRERYEE